MSVLDVRQLNHVYSPKTPFEKAALTDVSFTVEKGDFVGIIGHTGSGKSTLVQHLNGLMKPTSGSVLLDGKDIWENPKEIRSVRFRVGMVFQYPEHQLFEETVYRDIAFGPKNMGLSVEEIDTRVRRAARFAEIRDELLDSSPFDLSGGQKRRVAIAGVMAMEPEVLILDEPTAGLDPKGREQILSRIAEWKKETGATVLLVSHSMEDVAEHADKVLVMNGGRLAFYDITPAIFSNADELHRIGLDVPDVTRIFSELRRRGFAVGDNAFTVDQAVERLLPLLKKEGTVC